MKLTWTNALLLALVVIVLGVALYVFGTGEQADQIAENNQTTTSQLAADLAGVTPQFVGKTLTPELQKIKEDVKAILISNTDNQEDVSLNAVGKRYVVATVLSPTDAGSSPQIIDSMTQQINIIPGLFQFETGKTAIYVSAQDICTYTLDQASCVELPGAKLTGNEAYGDDEQMAGYFTPQDETHTNISLTIAVLQWIPSPQQGCPDCKVLKKVRDVTFTLP